MSILDNLDTGDAKDTDTDVIRTYTVLDSGIYPFFVEEAYLITSAQGAVGVQLTMKENKDGSGRVYEEALWIKSKNGKSYWTDDNGNHVKLPGLTIADSLCMIICGKELRDMKTSRMIVQRWNSTEKKRMPEEVEMLKALLGKPVYVAVMHNIIDETRKANDGSYKPTGKTRTQNEIVKFFRAKDKKTVTEIAADNDEPAAFYHTWLENYKGVIRNKAKNAKNANGNAGASNPAATADAGIGALFSD